MQWKFQIVVNMSFVSSNGKKIDVGVVIMNEIGSEASSRDFHVLFPI